MRSCQAPPFWKFGRRFNLPSSRKGGGVHTMLAFPYVGFAVKKLAWSNTGTFNYFFVMWNTILWNRCFLSASPSLCPSGRLQFLKKVCFCLYLCKEGTNIWFQKFCYLIFLKIFSNENSCNTVPDFLLQIICLTKFLFLSFDSL